MKKLLFLPFLLLVLASCKKNAYEYATPNADNSTTTTGGTPANTDTKASAADTGHTPAISFAMPDQISTLKSNHSTLTVTYHEHAILFVNTENYRKSYAVHLKEDFSGSDLTGYDFTVFGRGGGSTFNWADDNLNNVDKTLKDTVINNIAVTKIEIARTFNFTHTFDSDDAATTAYNKLLSTKTQGVSFAAYLASADPAVTTFIAKATLLFTAEGN